MGTRQQSTQLAWAWAQQRIWSQAASRLKQRIDQARLAALLLGIATAVLAVAAHQIGGLSKPAGQALSATAAITAGLATIIQRRVSSGQIKDWTRTRSASEGLKTEIYSYLGGGTGYAGPYRDQRLGTRTNGIVDAVSDLRRRTLGIEPDGKLLPPVHDTSSYVDLRVNDQIRNYYDKKAGSYERQVRRLRAAGDLLGVTAVVLAAVAAALGIGSLPQSAPRSPPTSPPPAMITWLSNSSAPASVWNACAASFVTIPVRTPQASSTPAKLPSRSRTRHGWPAGTRPTKTSDKPRPLGTRILPAFIAGPGAQTPGSAGDGPIRPLATYWSSIPP
jgi:hypothetical protein